MIAVIIMGFGCLFFLAGTVGVLRFPDTLSRLHALTKADNVGLGLICLGLALHDRTASGILLLFFIWLLAICSATLSAFLIARWHQAHSGDES
nr:monovalent cation/H(+) antiporter subunit G [Natronospira proteinivora]